MKMPATGKTKDQISSEIEDALERQAEREAKEIHIDVQDGRVSLSGVVHSWAEKKAVIAAARGASGVKRVDNELRIVPYVA